LHSPRRDTAVRATPVIWTSNYICMFVLLSAVLRYGIHEQGTPYMSTADSKTVARQSSKTNDRDSICCYPTTVSSTVNMPR
jgi:hypothetical protein